MFKIQFENDTPAEEINAFDYYLQDGWFVFKSNSNPSIQLHRIRESAISRIDSVTG